MRHSKSRGVTARVGATLLGLTTPMASQAQTLETGPFEIDDQDPVASVPTAEQAIERPLEMGYHVIELTDRADAASQRGDHAAAARYYLAVGKAAPDRAIGFSKACEAYETAEMWDDASAACKQALGREGVRGEDFRRFALTTLRKDPLPPGDVNDLDAVLGEMSARLTSPEGRHLLTTLACQLAVRTEAADRLRTCAEAVTSWSAGDPQRLTFLTVEALARDDFDAARAAVNAAHTAGAPPELVERATRQIAIREHARDDARGLWSRFGWLGVLGLLALLSAAVAFTTRRRTTAEA